MASPIDHVRSEPADRQPLVQREDKAAPAAGLPLAKFVPERLSPFQLDRQVDPAPRRLRERCLEFVVRDLFGQSRASQGIGSALVGIARHSVLPTGPPASGDIQRLSLWFLGPLCYPRTRKRTRYER